MARGRTSGAGPGALIPTFDPRPARNAVALAFIFNGWCFATMFTRLPDVRRILDLSNGQLGLLLLSTSLGSILALPATGRLIERWSAAAVVRGGSVLVAGGLIVSALGVSGVALVPVVAVGWFAIGVGVGTWDVAMNVEAAAVEQRLGRTVMPRFHAGWSMGSIAGAAVGIPVNALDVPLLLHWSLGSLLAVAVVVSAVRAFLPVEAPHEEAEGAVAGRSAWTDPRTLAIGLMVLAFALTEGAANDWLALGLIDGYDVPDWQGVAGFALFVVAMTIGRLAGPLLLDRYGRVPVLRTTAVLAIVGLLMVIYGGHPAFVAPGIVIWGLGASLGFPVGMSAAADDPVRSARRVSVVSTIGYGAFLAGPPTLGFIGDHVGTLESLLVVAVLLVPSALVIGAAREQSRR